MIIRLGRGILKKISNINLAIWSRPSIHNTSINATGAPWRNIDCERLVDVQATTAGEFFLCYFYSNFVKAKGLIVAFFGPTLYLGVPRCINRGVVDRVPELYYLAKRLPGDLGRAVLRLVVR